jgi:hypothetical protein
MQDIFCFLANYMFEKHSKLYLTTLTIVMAYVLRCRACDTIIYHGMHFDHRKVTLAENEISISAVFCS